MSGNHSKSLYAALIAGAATVAAHDASAAIVITEVDPFASSGTYKADWFELTNTGTSAVNISGFTMADSHADSATSTSAPYANGTISIGNLTGSRAGTPAALTLAGGSTTLAAGQTAIFLESPNSAASSSTLISSFESAWFGSKVPVNLAIGTYNDGSSTLYGLGTDADMVNIFNGSAANSSLVASVAFGADGGTPESTFDNAIGLNNATISQKSVAGANGAFVSANGAELGSPGVVPLPPALALFLSGLGAIGLTGYRKKQKA